MSQRSQRRQFLKAGAVSGIGIWVAGRWSLASGRSPAERLGFACIGIDGAGAADANALSRWGEVVALCDVDEGRLDGAGKRFPRAKRFTDFRKMLSEMEKQIDGVTVSTPDHGHAAAAAQAITMGKACFVQSPLAHAVYEARFLGQLARKSKVATQMGNQATASATLRRSAAMLRANVVGAVKEVHVWTSRPIWLQGLDRPRPAPPPAGLKWDLWLGPAAMRPYGRGYHPVSWRGWWDFGTGALGDTGCHLLNLPYMALDLKDPIAVQATTSGHNRDSFPNKSLVKFEFPATATRPALTLFWYDGGNRPPAGLLGADLASGGPAAAKTSARAKMGGIGRAGAPSGCLVVGEKGKMYVPGDFGDEAPRFSKGIEPPKVEVLQSPGHFEEWVRAIKGGPPPMSSIPDYAGPLAETILLGNVAVWAATDVEKPGKRIEWDAAGLKAPNAPEVAGIIRPTYRGGYTL